MRILHYTSNTYVCEKCGYTHNPIKNTVHSITSLHEWWKIVQESSDENKTTPSQRPQYVVCTDPMAKIVEVQES